MARKLVKTATIRTFKSRSESLACSHVVQKVKLQIRTKDTCSAVGVCGMTLEGHDTGTSEPRTQQAAWAHKQSVYNMTETNNTPYTHKQRALRRDPPKYILSSIQALGTTLTLWLHTNTRQLLS